MVCILLCMMLISVLLTVVAIICAIKEIVNCSKKLSTKSDPTLVGQSMTPQSTLRQMVEKPQLSENSPSEYEKHKQTIDSETRRAKWGFKRSQPAQGRIILKNKSSIFASSTQPRTSAKSLKKPSAGLQN